MIVPILQRKKWHFEPTALAGTPTLAEINEEGVLDNINSRDDDAKLIDNICWKYFREAGIETNDRASGSNLYSYMTMEELNKDL